MKLLKHLLEASKTDQDKIYDTSISYTDKDGKSKRIKVKSALSYEKAHPAYKIAAKFLQWYGMKPPKTAGVKGGKEEPKKAGSTKGIGVPTKSKKVVQPKSNIDFKSSAEKRKTSTPQEGPIYKTMVYRDKDPDDVRLAIINKGKSGISDKKYSSLLNAQTDYWEKSVKDKKFFEGVSDWRDRGLSGGRDVIDKYIQKNPPPPIQMKSPVWRGMGMDKSSYNKFLKMLEGKSEIKLPPSSFSFDVNTAVEFAAQTQQVIINLRSECNELNAIALSELPGQESIYSDKEKELITPSNATYKIESVKTVEFEYNVDKITMVNLIQKCGMTESVDTFADFSKDEFMDSLFGPTQTSS